jgi:hypothetical protein
MATGLIQPPVQWVMEAFSLGVKQLGCEADISPPFSDEVKNAWNYTSIFPYIFMVWHSLMHKETLPSLLPETFPLSIK